MAQALGLRSMQQLGTWERQSLVHGAVHTGLNKAVEWSEGTGIPYADERERE